jgi:2-(1,2-epoxy-1,2-dihydrophenyl)acetyl-CoA isomerase
MPRTALPVSDASTGVPPPAHAGFASPNVRLAVQARVATVTLTRPDVANAISLELAHDLMRALHLCEDADDVGVVVLAAMGPVFCGGGDLAAIRAQGPGSAAYVRELLLHLHEAIQTIARLPTPVIAAVQGAAAGAGLALASSCDLIVCVESARFSMSYTRVGATPDGSSTWYLPRIVGLRRALELTLLNRELTAVEARDWGLVTEVVADGELAARVGAMSERLAGGASEALGDAKRLIRGSWERSLAEQLNVESEAICRAVSTDTAGRLMDRFLARRTDGRTT